MNAQLLLRLRQFAFTPAQHAYLNAASYGPLMWPGNFLPPWVDCYAGDSDPVGYSFCGQHSAPE
eukprot:1628240-Lingulodinium_polyedra.AAC.1